MILQLRVVLVSALVDLLDKLPDKLWISKVHESYLIQSIISSLSASIKVGISISAYLMQTVKITSH